ncbi:MAG: hypothetical protein PHW82_13215 [Bacteroidales bacterium]|nr:hypothetical protein [Bacteroidales bacterium]
MKTLILIVIIYLFSSIVSAQDTNDTVILIWHKKNLNTLQLQEFDSLRNFIFNTYEDVVYFRQVCPNYPDGENYYHLRCGENRLSIMSQLSSKSNILDSIQFDKAVNNSEMGCVNPINVNDPLMINYYVSEMLDLLSSFTRLFMITCIN